LKGVVLEESDVFLKKKRKEEREKREGGERSKKRVEPWMDERRRIFGGQW
jgi:hypothetical protein